MLSQEQIVVEEKKAATQLLIESIGKEKAVVDEAVESSRGDEEAAARLQVLFVLVIWQLQGACHADSARAPGGWHAQADVTAFQDECAKDLAVAEPVIKEAEAALNSLDKASLGELKSFGSPAAEIVNVVAACMMLTAAGGKIPKARSCCSHAGTADMPDLRSPMKPWRRT